MDGELLNQCNVDIFIKRNPGRSYQLVLWVSTDANGEMQSEFGFIAIVTIHITLLANMNTSKTYWINRRH